MKKDVLNKYKIKYKKKKILGFTLIELLAVIVILAIILLIAVPSVFKSIEETKDKSFYFSVNNIVESIKPINITENTEKCIFEYEDDDNTKEIKTDLIKEMFVIVENNDGKYIYSVYAKSNNNKVIFADDFSKINSDATSWDGNSEFNSLVDLIAHKEDFDVCIIK